MFYSLVYQQRTSEEAGLAMIAFKALASWSGHELSLLPQRMPTQSVNYLVGGHAAYKGSDALKIAMASSCK